MCFVNFDKLDKETRKDLNMTEPPLLSRTIQYVCQVLAFHESWRPLKCKADHAFNRF